MITRHGTFDVLTSDLMDSENVLMLGIHSTNLMLKALFIL